MKLKINKSSAENIVKDKILWLRNFIHCYRHVIFFMRSVKKVLYAADYPRRKKFSDQKKPDSMPMEVMRIIVIPTVTYMETS